MRRRLLVSMTAITFLGSATAPAMASAPMLSKAKQDGLPAQSCQYCHVSKAPKKDTFKPDDLNERGAWLEAEKTKQKAKAVDVKWLKDYPGGKEQK